MGGELPSGGAAVQVKRRWSARRAVLQSVDRFHRPWLVECLQYRSPREAYAAFLASREMAA